MGRSDKKVERVGGSGLVKVGKWDWLFNSWYQTRFSHVLRGDYSLKRKMMRVSKDFQVDFSDGRSFVCCG